MAFYFFKPEHGAVGWAGADYTVHGRGVLRAIDYQTGKVRWGHDLHGGAGAAGVLTTATGLTFTGDSANNALALRTSDGTTLWHAGIGRVVIRLSPTSWTDGSTCCSAAGLFCMRGRFRD
jgi:alcohol dehydrogenase (cytochrome c)